MAGTTRQNCTYRWLWDTNKSITSTQQWSIN